MGRTRRSFSQEFKVEAVRLLTEKKSSVAQVTRDLRIRDRMLRRWKQELARNPTTAFPGQGHRLLEKKELRQLQRRMPGYGWNETS